MARIYLLQIEGIYLTSNGLVGGKPCRATVTGNDALSFNFIRTAEPSIDGTPVIQTFDYTKGKPLSINIEILPKDVGEDLIALFNDAMDNATTLTVSGTNAETPDFSAECEFIKMSFRDFSLNAWNNVQLDFITA